MSQDRSREAALEFLDYLAAKGLVARATASARKVSLGKVLAILSLDEAQDVTNVDIDHMMMRFANLEGKGYTADSLKTYKSRVKSALDDFRSYLENPLAFKPNGVKRDVKTRPEASRSRPEGAKQVNVSIPHEPDVRLYRAPVPSFDETSIMPIPLRQDLVVRIHGLPFDLSEAEARKIANVIMALAGET